MKWAVLESWEMTLANICGCNQLGVLNSTDHGRRLANGLGCDGDLGH